MFHKIMNDSQRHDKKIQEDLKAKVRHKIKLDKIIDGLNNQISLVDNKMHKVEEELQSHKSTKQFLDILAIEAGLKKFREQLKVDDSLSDLNSTKLSKKKSKRNLMNKNSS